MTSTPVIETILHPPIGAIRRELITGTFTGSGTLTRDTGNLPPFNHVNAYGLTWTFFTVPVGYGHDLGTPVVYELPMLRVATVHEDFLGHQMVSEWHDFFSEGLWWLWNNAGPTLIHYDISPGVAVIFYWLIVRFP